MVRRKECGTKRNAELGLITQPPGRIEGTDDGDALRPALTAPYPHNQ
jgi:hypothetical protein